MYKIFVMLIMFSLGASMPVQAFSKLGHQLVCEIGYQSLSPQNQKKIDNLLQLIPVEHKTLINTYARVSKKSTVSFANACLWADAIKRHKTLGVAYKRFKSWHYINVERDDLVVTEQSCADNCVTQAIAIHQQDLKERKMSWEKTQALMFLGHWVADIHQPMHVSFASDLGGNKLKVKWLTDEEGKNRSKNKQIINCNSMHMLWDDCLLRMWDKKLHDKTLFKTHLNTLNQVITALPAGKIEAIIKTDQWQWATESLSIARDPQVQYCQHQANNNSCLAFKVQTMYLLPDYYQEFAPVVLERIMFAGLRLGQVLKKSLI